MENGVEANENYSIFNKIKAYVSNIRELLNPAADNIAIDKLESICGKKLPKVFRNLYLEHNGEGEMIFGIMAGFRWMDIDSIIREWSSLQKSEYYIMSDKDGFIKEGKYKKGWIPFAEDCGGSFLAIDLEPGARGIYGQIITIDHDSDISYVVSESLTSFLEFIENSFNKCDMNICEDDDVKVIKWKNGHFFDDVIALTGTQIEKSVFPVSGFWTEYFRDELIDGCISSEALAKKRMVFIKADKAKKFGEISLDILKVMTNLKELIIHADSISDFEPIKDIPSLTKLVLGSKSFKQSDLEYIVNAKKLKELTLVNNTLQDISSLGKLEALKCLRMYKMHISNISSIKNLKKLKELSLEDMEVGDLSYISVLNKLTKLELKNIVIPNLLFLQDLKKLTIFETDRKAEDESGIEFFQKMDKLQELIYPIGNMEIIKNCSNLKSIGVDAPKFEALECISDLNITSITIFNALSEENANSVVFEFEKYFKLQSYGWQQTWED